MGCCVPTWRATVEIEAPIAGRWVAVPDSAVIDSGKRQVVLVERGEGRYEPRPVKLGARVQGYVQVLDGLKPGERVVTSATFLIDAESNLRAALGAFTAGDGQMIAGLIPLVGAQPAADLRRHAALTGGGLYAIGRVSLDAIPDLSRHSGDRLTPRCRARRRRSSRPGPPIR